ncbi:MAG: hypothetical protein JRN52_09495 [Nitrososphaerota archaeon]|nr:hypothetical protein [Nitrososphaerota archaeon]
MKEMAIHFDSLDWTLVGLPKLTDGNATDRFRSSVCAPLHHRSAISRADLASYLVSIIDQPATYKHWTEVSWQSNDQYMWRRISRLLGKIIFNSQHRKRLSREQLKKSTFETDNSKSLFSFGPFWRSLRCPATKSGDSFSQIYESVTLKSKK